MNDYISLQSVTPDDGGIFTALNTLSVPWKNTVSPELIDLQYYGNVSGEKIISPLVYKQLNSDGKLTAAKQGLIASMIFSMFGTNWTKEWETLSMEYDPIANYDMTEVMTDDETVTEYGKTNTRTNDLTHAKTGTETDAPSVSVTTNDTVHGFNSSNAVPTDGRSQSTSGSDITTFDTSDTDTGTVTDVGSGSDTSTRNYELTRKGNIGVTSSQQLLQSERDLWVWNYFLDVVFPDVDKILTIPIYAEETSYTGAAEPTGTINIVENELHIDVKQFAFADVMVPNTYTEEDQGKVVSGDDLVSQTSRTIMENDTYNTTTNNSVVVNVPNSYSAADEGKVVSDGALVSQSSQNITTNGLYDTTLINAIDVNVPNEMAGFIKVTYTPGAVCTVSNGSITITGTGSGYDVFQIPSIGNWTVTTSYNNITRTKTVNVSLAGVYDVVLLSETLNDLIGIINQTDYLRISNHTGDVFAVSSRNFNRTSDLPPVLVCMGRWGGYNTYVTIYKDNTVIDGTYTSNGNLVYRTSYKTPKGTEYHICGMAGMMSSNVVLTLNNSADTLTISTSKVHIQSDNSYEPLTWRGTDEEILQVYDYIDRFMSLIQI